MAAVCRVLDTTPAHEQSEIESPWHDAPERQPCFQLIVPAERAQLIGRYVALGVDAPLWERLALAVPEIIPRGAHGWRKYY